MEKLWGLGNTWLLLFLVLVVCLMQSFVSRMECLEMRSLRHNNMSGSQCFYRDRESCGRRSCSWCDLPQECYLKAFAKELGVNCHGSQRRQLAEVKECGDVGTEEECLSYRHCRWCTSQVLNDGCFRSWDARRLPHQVFDCKRILA